MQRSLILFKTSAQVYQYDTRFPNVAAARAIGRYKSGA